MLGWLTSLRLRLQALFNGRHDLSPTRFPSAPSSARETGVLERCVQTQPSFG